MANRPIDLWDVLGLYAGGATSGEVKDIIAEVGLDGSWAIRNTDSDAYACMAGVSPAKSHHGGEQDAVRHCVWLCLMSEKLGYNSAMAVAGIHEKHHPPPTVPKPPKGYATVEDWSKADTEMDNSNNNFGAQLGRACGHKNCCTECKSALKQGLLKVNSPGGYDFRP